MRQKILAIAAVVVVLVLGTTFVASASIPDSAGVINACIKHNGNIQIIDTEIGQSCSTGDQPLSWNVAGPAGPPGPPGPAGNPQIITRIAHYDAPSLSAGGLASFTETVTCGPGLSAIGGGVLQSEADATWTPSAPGTENNASQPGNAFSRGGDVEPPTETPAQSRTVLSLPRPVDNGTGWRMSVSVAFPISYEPEPARYHAIDVTLFALCVG